MITEGRDRNDKPDAMAFLGVDLPSVLVGNAGAADWLVLYVREYSVRRHLRVRQWREQ